MVCPELTEQIRREIAASLHQRKGDFACYFLTDLVTFTLPAGNYEVLLLSGNLSLADKWVYEIAHFLYFLNRSAVGFEKSSFIKLLDYTWSKFQRRGNFRRKTVVTVPLY